MIKLVVVNSNMINLGKLPQSLKILDCSNNNI